MRLLHTAQELRTFRESLRAGNKRVALVPTMGALHAGHTALVAEGLRHADACIVTVFVNPTQFGPNEDFTKYPRTIEADLATCREAGAAAVFAPTVETLYPTGSVPLHIGVPALMQGLEDAFRPGHFEGVCRVVAKLLCLALPEVAVFGQKDYQQLKVIEALNADLMLPTRIVPHPTVYEADGLAKSSRNRYLSAEERQSALGIPRALAACAAAAEAGETRSATLEAQMRTVLEAAGLKVDYATIRARKTLAPVAELVPGRSVALITARAGTTRLLDNREL